MKREIDTVVLPLTKELAEEFATMPSAPGERPYKKDREAKLRSIFDAGDFHSPDWAYCYFKGRKVRLNGQHSSSMLSKLNGEFPTGMKVAVKFFQCESEQELAELFEQFDPPFSLRTQNEYLNAHAKSERALDGVSATCIRTAVAGIAMNTELNGGGRLNNVDRARIVHSHQEFIVWSQSFCHSKPLRLSSVMAAVYQTWLMNADAAAEFWDQVHTESNPSHDHPTRVLSRFLNATRFAAISKETTTKRRYTSESIFERCAHCWNAFRDGRELKQLKYYGGRTSGPIRFK